MTLTRTLLLVSFIWISVALAEFASLYFAIGLFCSLAGLIFIKSKLIRFSLVILTLSLSQAIWKEFRPPPLFLRYYQYFNPNLISFFTPLESPPQLSSYQISLGQNFIFTDNNWISDGERLIHMAAVEPLVLAQSWLKYFDPNFTMAYVGPTPPEFCARAKTLAFSNLQVFYPQIFEETAECGEISLSGQVLPQTHILTFGPLDEYVVPQWIERFKKSGQKSWSVWHCPESLARVNSKNLPNLSQQLEETNKKDLKDSVQEFYIELPFVSCEVIGTADVFSFKKERQLDPIIVRQLKIPKEAP